MEHIKKILNRRSERKYLNKEIEKEKLNKIFEVINSSPTSNNSQDYSVIVVNDKKLRETISLNLPTQKHIIEAPLFLMFCADLNRIDYLAQLENKKVHTNTLNALITAIGDCFISSTFAHSAALELGLGSCYIGIARKSSSIIQKVLNLENKMIPVIGLTVGYIESQNEIKPKINHIYHDKYDLNLVKKEAEEYNKKMLSYYDSRMGNKKYITWSESVLKAFEFDTKEIDDFIKNQWGLSK